MAIVGVLQLGSWNSILGLYTHTVPHVFNLCIVKSTSISDARNLMDIADKVARFFNYSPKRQLALEWHIHQLHQQLAEV